MLNTRRTRACLAGATGLIGLPVVMLPGPGIASPPATTKADHPLTRVQPPALPGLEIGVSDGRTTARTGDQLTYLVQVRDSGASGARRLKITQTLPPGTEFLSASRPGTVADGQVTWYAGVAAGGADAFRVTVQVTRTPARLVRLAAVACVARPDSRRPVICAAHLDRLPASSAGAAAAATQPPPASGPALRYLIGGSGMLAAGVLAAIAGRHVRRRRRLPA